MQMSRDGSSFRSGPVPDGGGTDGFGRTFGPCAFEGLDTGALVVRQGREFVHLAPNQVDALLQFLEMVSRLATAEMRAAIESVEADES
jgi:hypothetical protein